MKTGASPSIRIPFPFLSLLLVGACGLPVASLLPGGGAEGGGQKENRAPTATDLSITANFNAAASSNLLGEDPDGDTLTYEILTSPSIGTVSLTDTATGAFTYTPSANASGHDSFTFKVSDGRLASEAATVSVTVQASVDAPVAVNITPSAFEENTQSGIITLSYSDAQNDLATSCAISNLVGVTVSQACACDGAGVCTVRVSGNASFTGAAGFSYTVTANSETSNTATASFTITAASNVDLTDDDDDAEGFGGTTVLSGLSWHDTHVRLDAATNNSTLDATWTPDYASVVGYWQMEGANAGTSFTETIAGRSTTAYGNAQSSTAQFKVGGASALFDGAGDYLEVPNATAFDLGGTFAVQSWVRLSSLPGAEKFILGNIEAGTATSGWGLGIDATHHLRFHSSSDDVVATVHPLAAGVWHHVVATGDGTTIRLYLDGNLVGSQNVTNDGASSQTLRIGSVNRSNLTNYDWPGYVDEVAMWKGASLSQSEVTQIYLRQAPRFSGTLLSRIVNYGSANVWDGLRWITTLPFGKDLPGDANDSGTITAADSESSSNYSALVGSTGNTTDNDLMGSLVALWRLNGSVGVIANGATVADAGPGGYDGTVADSDATIRYDHARVNQGIRFDGVNDSVGTGTLGSFGSGIGSPTSISLWFKTTSTAVGTLLGTMNAANTTAYMVRTNVGTPGTIQFFMRDDANRTLRMYGGSGLNDGRWHHLAVVTNPSSMNGQIWIDGVSQAVAYTGSSGSLTTFSDFVFPLALGVLNGASPVQYHAGSLDEVAIWSRALHADEIKQIYRRGANRILFQVRTCDDAACSGDTWVGPDNTSNTFFSEAHNYAPYRFETNNCAAANLISTGSPSLLFSCFTAALSNLTSQARFQYRAILQSDDLSTTCDYGSGATWCSPELKSVEIKR